MEAGGAVDAEAGAAARRDAAEGAGGSVEPMPGPASADASAGRRVAGRGVGAFDAGRRSAARVAGAVAAGRSASFSTTVSRAPDACPAFRAAPAAACFAFFAARSAAAFLSAFFAAFFAAALAASFLAAAFSAARFLAFFSFFASSDFLSFASFLFFEDFFDTATSDGRCSTSTGTREPTRYGQMPPPAVIPGRGPALRPRSATGSAAGSVPDCSAPAVEPSTAGR